MKKILVFLLAVTMAISLVPLSALAVEGGNGELTKNRTYQPGRFVDVQESDWFSPNVCSVYEYGIMEGVDGSRFDPKGQVTVAQALTIGCRIHQSFHHTSDSLSQGSPWYQVYYDYAKKYDLVSSYLGEDTANEPIERYGFAMILSSAVPDEALPVINQIEAMDLPDVGINSYYADDVYRLYRAGILVGNDSYGTFSPWNSIRRNETAAIVSRILEPSLRIQTSFEPVPDFVPVPIDQLENRAHLQMKATDQEFAEAYDVAVELVAPIARYALPDQLETLKIVIQNLFWEGGMEYSMEADHYNDPYGYFILGTASCAGCVRATGLCLNILGISYEHVNENQYSHQWARVQVGDEYWICDAFGDYIGPELEPYQHPNPFLS